jgi:prolyl-tRNA editing enzyme YbaK/EbsC (Cys-tRNA(Pro) deacylase)
VAGVMAGAIDRFLEAARAHGLEPDVRRFPEGTKTAEDAARAIGCDVAQIVKSLVFMADDRPVLALTSGRNRVDTDALAGLAGASTVRRATPDEARAATGFAVGGTPPFGHPQPITTFLDVDLTAHDEVWAAAGTPDAIFRLSPEELLRVSRATEARFSAGEMGRSDGEVPRRRGLH